MFKMENVITSFFLDLVFQPLGGHLPTCIQLINIILLSMSWIEDSLIYCMYSRDLKIDFQFTELEA